LTVAPSRLSQSNTGSAAVFVDEFDAGLLKGASYSLECRTSRFARPGFELVHCYNSDAGCVSKLLLAPPEKPAAGPALLGRDHPLLDAGFAIFLQFHRKSIDLWKHIIYMFT
jgi:hypothetical protein